MKRKILSTFALGSLAGCLLLSQACRKSMEDGLPAGNNGLKDPCAGCGFDDAEGLNCLNRD